MAYSPTCLSFLVLGVRFARGGLGLGERFTQQRLVLHCLRLRGLYDDLLGHSFRWDSLGLGTYRRHSCLRGKNREGTDTMKHEGPM